MNNKDDRIPLFPQIRNDIEAAKNRRELDRAAAQIGRVPNLAHQRQLSAIYARRKHDLSNRG